MIRWALHLHQMFPERRLLLVHLAEVQSTSYPTQTAVMGRTMRRREFIVLLGSAVAASPLDSLGNFARCGPIERTAQLRDGAVDGVEREAGRRAVGELERRFLDAVQGTFRNQPNAVNERVTSHALILEGSGVLTVGGS